jgi:hypothetical protein
VRRRNPAFPVANWRATASMPNVPLPGTTITECAWYASFRIVDRSRITRWNFCDM